MLRQEAGGQRGKAALRARSKNESKATTTNKAFRNRRGLAAPTFTAIEAVAQACRQLDARAQRARPIFLARSPQDFERKRAGEARDARPRRPSSRPAAPSSPSSRRTPNRRPSTVQPSAGRRGRSPSSRSPSP